MRKEALRLFVRWALLPLLMVPLLWAQESNFRQNAWARIPEGDEPKVEALAGEYKAFLRRARHELLAVAEAERLAQQQGFRPLESVPAVRPGDRVYVVNRGRAMILAVVGKRPLIEGAVIVASHLDTPRIELKANPLYDKEGFALFQTNYYGGIKNYQWANLPLALVGRVTKKDGTRLDIAVGLEGEPYLVIPDMAPHEDRMYRERKQREVLQGEELDPIVGSRPDAGGSVAKQVEALLKEKYGLAREDFVSAQLALVPALAPADVGVDSSLVGAYGQDDLLCSFIALRALFDVQAPEKTAMVYLAANEEEGSQNVMGASSTFLADTVLTLLEKSTPPPVTLATHRKAMAALFALSADVSTGVHPIFADTQEETNAARLGRGVIIKRYGKGDDPTTEALARVRRVLDENAIPWQTHTYKVDVGGGGTLGQFLSDDGIDVVDVGAPILAMHSPWNLASKADLWWLYRFLVVSFTRL